ncbi:MAG: hypothetical protein COB38_12390 [Gammaproteobacteria bacterium]|nr:MAG: hypothetical protein COB38_12390 [Gammaproteobacteria bacterium]
MKNILNVFMTLFLLLQILACGENTEEEDDLVEVPNVAPTSNAGVDQVVDEQTTVTLTGSGNDSDGSIASYAWVQFSGNTVELSNSGEQNISFDAPETIEDLFLEFELTVTDNEGAINKDRIMITVNPVNILPLLSVGVDQIVNQGELVELVADASDSDGSIVSYSWTQTSGITVELSNYDTSNVTFTADTATGEELLQFTVTITDNEGGEAVDQMTVEVLDVVQTTLRKLNDTGIVSCSDSELGGFDCPIAFHPGQDAEFGRDALQNEESNGTAGFDFVKLNSLGAEIASTELNWSCVQDNVTGLVWEVKNADQGLQYFEHTYSWYSTDSATNGGDNGTKNGGICSDIECDTSAYVDAINAIELCGATDWRMPNREELLSIVNFNKSEHLLDENYFPNLGSNILKNYLSSSAVDGGSGQIWYVNYNLGGSGIHQKSFANYIRLVRTND